MHSFVLVHSVAQVCGRTRCICKFAPFDFLDLQKIFSCNRFELTPGHTIIELMIK